MPSRASHLNRLPLMWILDSEGDLLDGKRVWLRPGQKYLFGRIRQDGVQHAIQHSSISRKHMVVEVSHVKDGDGSQIYAKSEIKVIDQSSKCGTEVDGNQIRGESINLTGEEHTIKLGRYQHLLRIKWQPVVLTFSFSSKELKAKDPLAHVRSRLEGLDIKTIIPYIVDKTTYVVQSKRNTAKGLQALVNGKYIVANSYVDALVYAATPSDLENLESLSPLEVDFESAWPDPTEHLPPPGKELVHRPAEAFAPIPDRVNLFEGYTFVFGDTAQFENLHDPIANGHGKALLYNVENNVTTADEIVQFMKNAAGGKGLGRQRAGPGGVVLVRFRTGGEWSIELSNQVALQTNQRVVEQSEFLDAILANDASSLCRTLPSSGPTSSRDISAAPASQPATMPEENIHIIDSQAVEDVSQPNKSKSKGPRVRSFVSKMKTFDDGFDINAIPAHPPDDEDVIMDSLPVMDLDTGSLSGQQTQPRSNLQEEEDVLSQLLPGANAMKRRRAETSQRTMDSSTSRPKEEVHQPKRQKLDILEAARQHREAEEDAQRQRQEEEAELQNSLKDIEKLKGLAIVEEMEMPARKIADEDSRWDERWNGRKNFKKFRKRGDRNRSRHMIQTVIVPLEEVTRKDFGIGVHYWISSHSKSTENSQAESLREPPISEQDTGESRPQSLARTESELAASRSQKRPREERDSDSDDGLRFRFRRRK
ncbi:DNA damage response protein RcaA [Aspergillus bertholletiae]|uniref:DNA damage response protein RcaA n=1 Tax=Aspergillus bertholletiae TaxID=1226010 RepID=A0A5N7AZ87_9EURO|nr:DNA damage response protein RcaA [Aspergillus bertholletiae]